MLLNIVHASFLGKHTPMGGLPDSTEARSHTRVLSLRKQNAVGGSAVDGSISTNTHFLEFAGGENMLQYDLELPTKGY